MALFRLVTVLALQVAHLPGYVLEKPRSPHRRHKRVLSDDRTRPFDRRKVHIDEPIREVGWLDYQLTVDPG